MRNLWQRISSHSDTLSPVGLLWLRLFSGGAMALTHGYPKLLNLLQGDLAFADPLGLGQAVSLVLAVGAEFGAALFVMVGLGTRVAAMPLIFTMAIAAFVVHGDDPFARQELALVYLACYVALLFSGPGRYSLDALLKEWKQRKAE